MGEASPVGVLIREWRQRRGLSQLAFSLEVAISTRHLSCVETGRAHPSRQMVLHVAERLDVPLRARNRLLVAAGYAPVYAERTLDETGLDAVRKVLDRVLDGHEPYPAIVIDGDWTVVAANPSAWWLASGVAPSLLEPPVNAMRFCLHPDGLAPAISSLPELRAHVLANLGRQAARTASPTLAELYDEIAARDRVVLPGRRRHGTPAARPAQHLPELAEDRHHQQRDGEDGQAGG
jgi:transcriptional regulator with XRE-family HTH domain